MRVVQGGVLPGSGRGQLAAVSSQHPGDRRAFQLHSDQVTFRSARGRGRARSGALGGDEKPMAKGLTFKVSSGVTHWQGPHCKGGGLFWSPNPKGP